MELTSFCPDSVYVSAYEPIRLDTELEDHFIAVALTLPLVWRTLRYCIAVHELQANFEEIQLANCQMTPLVEFSKPPLLTSLTRCQQRLSITFSLVRSYIVSYSLGNVEVS